LELEVRARFRRRAGLTLFDLARRVGKSQGTLSLWERGQIELSSEDVDKIANAIEAEINRIPFPKTREGIANALTHAGVFS
jgi:transcriptional regulator with XRE-family HTH domain